jgi:hypothetical protein
LFGKALALFLIADPVVVTGASCTTLGRFGDTQCDIPKVDTGFCRRTVIFVQSTDPRTDLRCPIDAKQIAFTRLPCAAFAFEFSVVSGDACAFSVANVGTNCPTSTNGAVGVAFFTTKWRPYFGVAKQFVFAGEFVAFFSDFGAWGSLTLSFFALGLGWFFAVFVGFADIGLCAFSLEALWLGCIALFAFFVTCARWRDALFVFTRLAVLAVAIFATAALIFFGARRGCLTGVVFADIA